MANRWENNGNSERLYSAAAAKSLHSCPTPWDPIDGSPPGSSVPGVLQARTLEWVAISFSNAWKWKVKVKSLSRVRLFTTPWTAAYQAPLPMGFSNQEYWSGVPLTLSDQYNRLCFLCLSYVSSCGLTDHHIKEHRITLLRTFVFLGLIPIS